MTADPAEIASLNHRVDEAIVGISDLRRSVESMTHATTELADIQREQAEQREKLNATEALAATTRTEAKQREINTRRRMRRFGWAVTIALLTLVGVAAAVAVYVSSEAARTARDLIDEANQSRYPSCIQRNASSEVQIQRERVLSAIPGLDPVEAQAHADSATALERLLVDCEQYRQP